MEEDNNNQENIPKSNHDFNQSNNMNNNDEQNLEAQPPLASENQEQEVNQDFEIQDFDESWPNNSQIESTQETIVPYVEGTHEQGEDLVVKNDAELEYYAQQYEIDDFNPAEENNYLESTELKVVQGEVMDKVELTQDSEPQAEVLPPLVGVYKDITPTTPKKATQKIENDPDTQDVAEVINKSSDSAETDEAKELEAKPSIKDKKELTEEEQLREEENQRLRESLEQMRNGGGQGVPQQGVPQQAAKQGLAEKTLSKVGTVAGAALGMGAAAMAGYKGVKDTLSGGAEAPKDPASPDAGTTVNAGVTGMANSATFKTDINFNRPVNDPVNEWSQDNIAKEFQSLKDSMSSHTSAIDDLGKSQWADTLRGSDTPNEKDIAISKGSLDYKDAMEDIQHHGSEIEGKISNLSEIIKDSGGDPDELNQIVDEWKDKAQEETEKLPDSEEKENLAKNISEVVKKIIEAISQMFSKAGPAPK